MARHQQIESLSKLVHQQSQPSNLLDFDCHARTHIVVGSYLLLPFLEASL